jgi:hypothetical protein
MAFQLMVPLPGLLCAANSALSFHALPDSHGKRPTSVAGFDLPAQFFGKRRNNFFFQSIEWPVAGNASSWPCSKANPLQRQQIVNDVLAQPGGPVEQFAPIDLRDRRGLIDLLEGQAREVYEFIAASKRGPLWQPGSIWRGSRKIGES